MEFLAAIFFLQYNLPIRMGVFTSRSSIMPRQQEKFYKTIFDLQTGKREKGETE